MKTPFAKCVQTGEVLFVYEALHPKYAHCDFVHPFLNIPVHLVRWHSRYIHKDGRIREIHVRSFFRFNPKHKPRYEIVQKSGVFTEEHQRIVRYMYNKLRGTGFLVGLSWTPTLLKMIHYFPDNELHIPDLVLVGNIGEWMPDVEDTLVTKNQILVVEIQRSNLSFRMFARRMRFYSANSFPVLWVFRDGNCCKTIKRFLLRNVGGYYVFSDSHRGVPITYVTKRGIRKYAWLPWTPEQYFFLHSVIVDKEDNSIISPNDWLFVKLVHQLKNV